MYLAETRKAPAVIATTGYDEKQLAEIKALSEKVPVFRSANMSLGVNVVESVLPTLASALKGFDVEIVEAHHNRKADAPSGTALQMLESVKKGLDYDPRIVYGREGESKREKGDIGVHAIRGGTIVGEHTVMFIGEDEIVEIKHTALSRRIFRMYLPLAAPVVEHIFIRGRKLQTQPEAREHRQLTGQRPGRYPDIHSPVRIHRIRHVRAHQLFFAAAQDIGERDAAAVDGHLGRGDGIAVVSRLPPLLFDIHIVVQRRTEQVHIAPLAKAVDGVGIDQVFAAGRIFLQTSGRRAEHRTPRTELCPDQAAVARDGHRLLRPADRRHLRGDLVLLRGDKGARAGVGIADIDQDVPGGRQLDLIDGGSARLNIRIQRPGGDDLLIAEHGILRIDIPRVDKGELALDHDRPVFDPRAQRPVDILHLQRTRGRAAVRKNQAVHAEVPVVQVLPMVAAVGVGVFPVPVIDGVIAPLPDAAAHVLIARIEHLPVVLQIPGPHPHRVRVLAHEIGLAAEMGHGALFQLGRIGDIGHVLNGRIHLADNIIRLDRRADHALIVDRDRRELFQHLITGVLALPAAGLIAQRPHGDTGAVLIALEHRVHTVLIMLRPF